MLKLVTRWTKIQEKADQRLEICKQCEHLEQQTTRCDKCGCFMKGKTKLPFAKCPIDKWPPYKED